MLGLFQRQRRSVQHLAQQIEELRSRNQQLVTEIASLRAAIPCADTVARLAVAEVRGILEAEKRA